uniref:Uncharacterized protein n=1 Tax=Phlebia radiata TaxID=5308 RepID=L8B9A7_PHLRA|nr:hypothetical protein PRA_mt0081 [Phlebia radiata]CCE89196.1 hypothetical protein PRA_mt0081 [Phlebia radiata]
MDFHHLSYSIDYHKHKLFYIWVELLRSFDLVETLRYQYLLNIYLRYIYLCLPH